jgi:hypothetical protein
MKKIWVSPSVESLDIAIGTKDTTTTGVNPDGDYVETDCETWYLFDS